MKKETKRKTKKMIQDIAIKSIFWGCLICGLISESKGLINIGLFMVWLLFVVLLCMLSEKAKQGFIKDYKPAFMAHNIIDNIFDITVLLFLLYFGYIFSAIAFAFQVCISLALVAEAKKKQEATE